MMIAEGADRRRSRRRWLLPLAVTGNVHPVGRSRIMIWLRASRDDTRPGIRSVERNNYVVYPALNVAHVAVHHRLEVLQHMRVG